MRKTRIFSRIVALCLAAMMLLSASSALAVEVNAPGTLPIVKEPITLVIGIEQSPTLEDFETNLQTVYMEENSGIALDFMLFPAGEMLTKLELMMAAGGKDLPDILIGNNFDQSVIMSWADAGYIIPVTQYYKDLFYWGSETLQYSTSYPTIDKVLPYITSYNGEIYGVYHLNDDEGNQYNGSRLNIYKPWLDKLGLEVPTTTDELYEVLKAFKTQDPNGNGIADEIPFTSYVGDPLNWTRRFLMTPFIYTQDSYYTVEDGKIGVCFNTDGWREGLRYVNKLYEEGLIDTAMFTQDQAALTVSCSQDPHVVGSYVRISTSNMSGDDLDRYNFVRIEQLTGPDGETRTSVSPAVPVIKGLITKNCKHPEAAFMLMDWMNGQDLSIISRYGFEGMTYVESDTEAYIAAQKEFWKSQPVNYADLFYGEDDSNPNKYPARKYDYTAAGLWGTMQNIWWGQQGPCTAVSPGMAWFNYGAADLESEKGKANYVNEYIGSHTLAEARQYRDDSLAVTGMIYNEEEQEVITDYYSELINYMKESWASFVTGAMDVDDDAVWNQYLQTLENMNVQGVIDATQSCYDRMNGK